MENMERTKVYVKKHHKDAKIPIFSHEGDACADIHSVENVKLDPGEIKLINTGISLELPSNYEAQIRPRSGLSLNHGLIIVNSPGTIDSGYRGKIKVIMGNLGEEQFMIKTGKRIAQIAVRPIPNVTFVETESLGDSDRGEDGFGSTGL